jgi:hypothetical protein
LELEVTDRTIEEEGKERCIEVDSLFVIEDEMRDGDEQREGRSFWQSVSLEELAEEQGVGVVSDIGSITVLWPADDDPDDLLDFVLRERCERRKVASPPTFARKRSRSRNRFSWRFSATSTAALLISYECWICELTQDKR